jgi:hypothetical protein
MGGRKKPDRGRMTVVAAVERELQEFDRRLPGIGESARAAGALAVAQELDDPGNSATSKSMCLRSLNETLDTLEARLPEETKRGKLDELRARRERTARGATA